MNDFYNLKRLTSLKVKLFEKKNDQCVTKPYKHEKRLEIYFKKNDSAVEKCVLQIHFYINNVNLNQN